MRIGAAAGSDPGALSRAGGASYEAGASRRALRQGRGGLHALVAQLAQRALIRALELVLLVFVEVDLPAGGVRGAGKQLVLEVLAHAGVVVDAQEVEQPIVRSLPVLDRKVGDVDREHPVLAHLACACVGGAHLPLPAGHRVHHRVGAPGQVRQRARHVASVADHVDEPAVGEQRGQRGRGRDRARAPLDPARGVLGPCERIEQRAHERCAGAPGVVRGRCVRSPRPRGRTARGPGAGAVRCRAPPRACGTTSSRAGARGSAPPPRCRPAGREGRRRRRGSESGRPGSGSDGGLPRAAPPPGARCGRRRPTKTGSAGSAACVTRRLRASPRGRRPCLRWGARQPGDGAYTAAPCESDSRRARPRRGRGPRPQRRGPRLQGPPRGPDAAGRSACETTVLGSRLVHADRGRLASSDGITVRRLGPPPGWAGGSTGRSRTCGPDGREIVCRRVLTRPA